nr:MAG TPA: hypothetical protein [Crassvirales sp.]
MLPCLSKPLIFSLIAYLNPIYYFRGVYILLVLTPGYPKGHFILNLFASK